ncbi:MAG TPA: DsbC family protein [Burkholderiales bacterium]|nr:DsbC family protein [Burkholderiales bacterium]
MSFKLLAAVAAISFAFSAHADDEANIRKSLQASLPNVKIGKITKLPYQAIYQVVGNGYNVFYTDEKGQVGFFGNLVDLKEKKNLTKEEADKLRHVDLASLPLDDAFVRVKGNGKRRLVLFSDPDCPFCQELEGQLKNVTDVTIYTFLYPLTSIHPDSRRKAEQIWCSKDRAKSWDDWMLEKKELPSGHAACKTPIDENEALAEKLWITGTPGMIFGDGKLVPGVLNKSQIEAYLNEAQSGK